MTIRPVSLADIAKAPLLFLPLFQSQSVADAVFFRAIPTPVQRALLAFEKKYFKGEEGEVKSVWFADGSPERVILVGLGAKDKWHVRKEPLLARRLVRSAQAEKIFSFGVPLLPDCSSRTFAINALMGQFDYTKYKTPPKEGWPEVKEIVLGVASDKKATTQKEIAEGLIIGTEVNATRELANMPGSDMTPALLAVAAVKIGKTVAGVKT